MKRSGILIAALAGMLIASQAQAQRPGVYIGIGGTSNWSHGGAVYNDTVNEDVSAGGKIYAGYRWDRFAMELGFNHLGKYEQSFLGAQISEMETRAVAISGVYTFPVAPGYTLGAKVGLAFTEAQYTCVSLCGVGGPPRNVDTKKRGMAGVAGLLLGMNLTQSLMVRIDFEHVGNVKHQVDLTEFNEAYDVLGVSLQLNF